MNSHFIIILFALFVLGCVLLGAINWYTYHKAPFRPDYAALKNAQTYMEKARNDKFRALWIVGQDIKEQKRHVELNPDDENLKSGLNVLLNAKKAIVRDFV